MMRGGDRGSPQGPPKPDRVQLHSLLAQLTEFELLLSVLESANSTMLDAVSKLEAAPGPLFEHLNKSHANELTVHLVHQLTVFVAWQKGAEPHLKDMQTSLQRLRFQSTRAREVSNIYEAALAEKIKCEKLVENLHSRNKDRFLKLDVKKDRLTAKCHSVEACRRSAEHAEFTIDRMFDHVWAGVGNALTELGHYCDTVSQSAPLIAHSLRDAATVLTGTQPLEQQVNTLKGDTAGSRNKAKTSVSKAPTAESTHWWSQLQKCVLAGNCTASNEAENCGVTSVVIIKPS